MAILPRCLICVVLFAVSDALMSLSIFMKRLNKEQGDERTVTYPRILRREAPVDVWPRSESLWWPTESAGHTAETSNNMRLQKHYNFANCVRGAEHGSPRENIEVLNTHWAVCDTETDGGGWIVVQRRGPDWNNYDRGWKDFKSGFGNPMKGYYVGNNVIHKLTNMGYNELRIDTVVMGKSYFSHYDYFAIGDEQSGYSLTLRGHTGNSSNSELTYRSEVKFSTFDRDNDHENVNCARQYLSSWWYDNCENYRCAFMPPEQWVQTQCHDFILNGNWKVNTRSLSSYPNGMTFSEIKVRLAH